MTLVLEKGPVHFWTGARIPVEPGVAIVFAGPKEFLAAIPGQPVDTAFLGLRGFQTFYRVDLTEKTETHEASVPSADVDFAFGITVSITAAVADPVRFLEQFGEDGDIFANRRATILDRIEAIAMDYQQTQIQSLRQRLAQLCSEVDARPPPQEGGVQIVRIRVSAKNDEKFVAWVGERRKIEEWEHDLTRGSITLLARRFADSKSEAERAKLTEEYLALGANMSKDQADGIQRMVDVIKKSGLTHERQQVLLEDLLTTSLIGQIATPSVPQAAQALAGPPKETRWRAVERAKGNGGV